jgi:hypothetical protein
VKCRVAQHWLLSCRCSEAIPQALRRHLGQCARCRKRYRKLVRLEAHFQTLLPDTGLHAFLARLPELPPRETIAVPMPARPARRSAVYWAASILLLIGLAALLFNFGVTPDDTPPKPPIAQMKPRADDQLVARFVQRDLLLADTTAPKKQWQILSDMADDLRGEAIRLTDLKSPDDVPMVVGLYERVLQRGLVNRSKSLPDADRRDLMAALAQRLRTQDDDLQQRLRLAPADWTTLLEPLHKANRRTADVLGAGVAPAAFAADDAGAIPGGSDYRRLLLSALVMNGIRLAEEIDPLKRADCCSDLADTLLQAIVTASVKGDQGNVSSLGKHLGEFVERGVSVNLARVPPSDPRVAELKQIMQRTNQILGALDKTVENMSAKDTRIDAKSLEQIKELEKMLKGVEKSLKKFHKSYKDGEKGKGWEEKEKEKEHKGKGKAKGWTMSPAPQLEFDRSDKIEILSNLRWSRFQSCRHMTDASA